MSRYVRLGEFLVGVSGVGLMRGMFDGDDATAEARMSEIRRIVCNGDDIYGLGVDVPTLDPRAGYARWSQTYDRPGNPLISVEEPVVWNILDGIGAGVALDAACGTGRHARRLVELGHRVVGVDSSPEMVAQAKTAVPEAEFRDGDLTALPVESETIDVVVCALALEHLRELDRAIAELARVVHTSGRVVISDLHPIARALGGAAYFQDASGAAGVVSGYSHLHGDYLRAFSQAGLGVRRCVEPAFGPAEVTMQGPASSLLPDATKGAYLGMPAALVWDLVRTGSGPAG